VWKAHCCVIYKKARAMYRKFNYHFLPFRNILNSLKLIKLKNFFIKSVPSLLFISSVNSPADFLINLFYFKKISDMFFIMLFLSTF
jgi:hypothetical protein